MQRREKNIIRAHRLKMSSKIGEYSEAHLLNVAKDVVEKKTKDSVALDDQAEARIPKFNAKGT